jgi:hypothetical protein
MALLPFQAIWFIGVIFAWLDILLAERPMEELAEISFDNLVGQLSFLIFSITPLFTLFGLLKKQRLVLYAALFGNAVSLLFSFAAAIAQLDPSNAMILLALFAPVVGVLGSIGGLSTIRPVLFPAAGNMPNGETPPN